MIDDISVDKPWLMMGDCLERMEEIPDSSVDMILADLPFGTTACSWDIIIPFDPLWGLYSRIIKANGAIVLNSAQPFTTLLASSNFKHFRYSWVWVKNTQTGISLAKSQPMRKHEDICVFYKNAPTFNPQMRETESPIMRNHSSKGYGRGLVPTSSEHNPGMPLRRTPFSLMINPSTVLYFPVVPNRSKERIHRSQKPVGLCEYMVRTYTNPEDIVLDNCFGSGTTGVACIRTGRRFIGIESDEKYFNVGQKRILESISAREMELA